MNTILAILLLSPITTTNYQCKGKTCVQKKKKTVKKTNRRYQRSKSTRVKRRSRPQNRNQALIKRRRGNVGRTPLRKTTRKPKQTTQAPKQVKTPKKTVSPQRRKARRMLLQWTTEILLSDPEYGHLYREALRYQKRSN